MPAEFIVNSEIAKENNMTIAWTMAQSAVIKYNKSGTLDIRGWNKDEAAPDGWKGAITSVTSTETVFPTPEDFRKIWRHFKKGDVYSIGHRPTIGLRLLVLGIAPAPGREALTLGEKYDQYLARLQEMPPETKSRPLDFTLIIPDKKAYDELSSSFYTREELKTTKFEEELHRLKEKYQWSDEVLLVHREFREQAGFRVNTEDDFLYDYVDEKRSFQNPEESKREFKKHCQQIMRTPSKTRRSITWRKTTSCCFVDHTPGAGGWSATGMKRRYSMTSKREIKMLSSMASTTSTKEHRAVAR